MKGYQEEIVLYHGSLDELNSRDSSRQYKFANEQTFFSERLGTRIWYNQISKELREEGYDGLVNRRTIFSTENLDMAIVGIEGTPIIRKK